jgi:cyclophilin family peptidyl-prolyl cis-trans isomerase
MVSTFGNAFKPEENKVQHNGPVIAMVQRNGYVGTEFYITSQSMQWLDGKNPVFGKLVSSSDLIQRLSSVIPKINQVLFQSC